MATFLITGGTGMIGVALSRMLILKGHRVVVLSRDGGAAARRRENEVGGEPGSDWKGGADLSVVDHAHWDPYKGVIDKRAIGEADFIVHLAGAGVADKRWSEKRKKEIVDSRVKSSELLVKALKEIPNKVQAVVSASGIGWYGADPKVPNPKPFAEGDPADDDFLGETCRLWEASIKPVEALGKRLTLLRFGPVLSNEGGALVEFRKPVRMGVAAILGSGKQVMSWIHVDDACRLILHAAENITVSGPLNAVAPQPADNKTLTLELARRMKGRYFVQVYVPSFLLKLIVGEMSVEVLKSCTVSALRTRQSGFQFLYPSVEAALDQLTGRE